jgi:uncharacterized protein (DUF302 family)
MATTGLTSMPSDLGYPETLSRLEAAIRGAGMTVFARIDHAAAAAVAQLPLRPTELLLFGNAKGGTVLMQSNQLIGLDLPLKALVYQDASGMVWVAYNDPAWLAGRHALDTSASPTVAAMTATIKRIVTQATGSAAP